MQIRLSVQAGAKTFPFVHAGPSLAIGRDPAGALALEQETPESVVSWQHARIDLTPAGATLTDLNSTNGTFINGRELKGAAPLRAGDTIRFGQSGPQLRVLELDLAATPVVRPAPAVRPKATVVEPPAAVVAAAAPTSSWPPKPPVRAGRGKAAPREVSETRGILLEAIRQQSAAHGRRRLELSAVAVVSILLLALLAVGLWKFGRDLGGVREETTAVAGDLKTVTGDLKGVKTDVETMRVQLGQVANRFDAVDQQLAAQKQADDQAAQRLEQLALEFARKEAQGKGRLDDLGATLDQINQALVKAARPPGAPDAAPAPRPDVAPAPVPAPAVTPPAIPPARQGGKLVRLNPGDRVEVLFRDTSVVGNLVSATAEAIRVMIIDGKTPKEIDMRQVKAVQTRDGIFAFNEEAGYFESAVTFYRHAGERFERMDGGPNVYLCKDVQIENGPQNFARALWATGPGGEMVIGLPMPESRSPQALQAYHLERIVSVQGVFTFNKGTNQYDFESHKDRAARVQAATNKAWSDSEEAMYQKRLTSYEAGTRRVQAIASAYARRWWWW